MIEITYHKEGDYFIPDLYLEKEDYENDYIIGKYGHLRLEYLKNHKNAEYIIMFMNKTLRKHIVETDKQAKERFEMLGRIFKEAVKQDYILKNPMLNVEKPKSDRVDEKIEAFSIEEQIAFLNILSKDKQYKNIFNIALYTGMRMGEILALQKDDINFKEGIINIKRSLTKNATGKTKLGKTTKTYNSTRTIPITPLFAGALKDAIANMTLNIKGLIFIQPNGELYSVSNMNSRFKRLCTNAGLAVIPYTIKRRRKGNTV